MECRGVTTCFGFLDDYHDHVYMRDLKLFIQTFAPYLFCTLTNYTKLTAMEQNDFLLTQHMFYTITSVNDSENMVDLKML